MKKTKPKGSSFSKSSTKAGTAAYNTKNKVKIAKEALAKRKEITKALQKREEKIASGSYLSTKTQKEEFLKQKDYTKASKKREGFISQALTDRTRSASRAAGIAKRVAKKGK
jgi:hypothetical protein